MHIENANNLYLDLPSNVSKENGIADEWGDLSYISDKKAFSIKKDNRTVV